MEPETFRIVISIAMIIAIAAAMLSIIGITTTGFYPGIIVLCLLVLIPVAARYYAKNIINRSNSFRKKCYTILAVINLLLILIILWMTFVIVHDRVLRDCC
ncbi:hypothetical protein COR50_09510 [Chitinophaga caeni]|uniref:Uncharacterized protein n=1 Tax=Chitinophaga caeni TaxID=2029983 RepID=A0A291QTW9_9BACT|nr:hypothetical protein [Chitinophaga caeni]ATL47386.1 hypothetical protein COR50_09510 [Chitinophaga caeni]